MRLRKKLFVIVAIAIVISIPVISVSGGNVMFRNEVENDVRSLFASSGNISDRIFTLDQLNGLPEPVQRYFQYSLQEGQSYVSYVRLKHEGTIRQSADQGWMPVRGEEYFTTQRPGEGGAAEGGSGQQQQLQQQVEQGQMRLIETVKDPSGGIVSNNEFSSDLFTTFQPQNTGNHILNITNAGSRPVTIDATFGHMPFITSASPTPSGGVDQPLPGVDLSSLFVVITGGILATVGFFTMIAGIVILVLDSRRRGEQESSGRGGGVTEGGITYRKD